MLTKIYILPMGVILSVMALSVVLWNLGRQKLPRRPWQICNLLLVPVSGLGIWAATLLGRSSGTAELSLQPFATLLLARENRELYRSMLMNGLLFLPLGLSLSQLCPRRCPSLLWGTLVVLAGCGLSCWVEWLQYTRALGRAEVDDVICNTLGTLLGTLSLLPVPRRKERGGRAS